MRYHMPTAMALAATIATGAAWLPAASAAPRPFAAEQQPNDDTLEDRIEFRLDTNETVRKYDVKVDVEGGVAKLSGEVATAAQKAQAETLAKIDGVTRVENTITVDANADKTVGERVRNGMSKTGEKITDAWITTKVKWFFVGEEALKDSNIDVDTKDHVVTLSGTVPSQAGRTRAVALAKSTEGVKNVVDRMTIATSR